MRAQNSASSLLLILLLILISTGLYAEKKQTYPVVRLITIAPTANTFEWFGHLALEVDFGPGNRSIAYNFGGFTFNPEDLMQFTMGKFTFWSFVETTSGMINRYSRSGRHIRIQTLNLSREQVYVLRRELIKATRPPDNYYAYDHFRENCSTRPRDLLDLALDGSLFKNTSVPAETTYRGLVNRMTGDLTILNFVLNFIMSDRVDQPISTWETMFLPDRLMAALENMTTETNRPLVIDTADITNQNPTHFFNPEVVVPGYNTAGEIVVGVCMAMLILLAYILYTRKSGIVTRIYPGLMSVYGLVGGFMGISLFFMGFIGSHVDTVWNENLYQLNPITFLLFPFGIALMFNKRDRAFFYIATLCGVSGIAGFILQILPAFDQVNGQQLRVLLPISAVIAISAIIEIIRVRKI